MNDEPTQQPIGPDYKSKSQLKREMHALQALGEQLMGLQHKELQCLSLPENLFEAIIAAQKITKHGARKRQIQYIGKIMRNVDSEPIIEYLNTLQAQSNVVKDRFRTIENLRDNLLTQGDEALKTLLLNYPQLDKQHIRSLIRNAKLQVSSGKAPKASRTLFKYLDSEINI